MVCLPIVELIARVLDTGAWAEWGIRSPEHWVAWKCGVSAGRARRLVRMARRLPELPETRAAFEAGELAEDQVAVVCRHAPAWADAEVAEFARYATVSQLSRTLRRYTWNTGPAEEEPAEEPRRVSFGFDEEGIWRQFSELPADEGALVERALEAQRRRLEDGGILEQPTWADALVAMAECSLPEGAGTRPARDRHLVLVHLKGDEHGNHLSSTWGRPFPIPFGAWSAVTGACARWWRWPAWR